MSEVIEQAVEFGPWTIKGFPTALRQPILFAANRRDETVAQWLARVATRAIETERGDRVEFPVQQQVLTPAAIAPAGMPAVDLAQLLGAVQIAVQLAAAAELNPPKALVRHAVGILTERVREARGLPQIRSRADRAPKRADVA